MQKPVIRVGVMVVSLSGYGTRILDGFSRYVQQKPDWRIALFDREQKELLDLIATWQGDAMLCSLVDQNFLNAAASRTIPMVNIAGLINSTDIPSVLSDDIATGRMAAEHLLERGFQNFAFVRRKDGTGYSKARGQGFVERIEEAGMKPSVISLATNQPDLELLGHLENLPRPLGIYVPLDSLGTIVIEACWQADLSVPEEIAVLGTGNHRQLCELCSPTLTSVEIDMERRGFEAGALLDRLLSGENKPTEPIRLPPAFVALRRSTDVFAFDDEDVARALRFISDNATQPIKVGDVVAATSISRRSLEGRFNHLVGRTIHDEIWRVHQEFASRLLSTSDLSLQEVAERSGFSNASALVNHFRQKSGMTPKEYRMANRR